MTTLPQDTSTSDAGLVDTGFRGPDAVERLFILGAPRSGTTFLASLLAGTRYGSPIESHFVTKFHSKLEAYGDLDVLKNFTRLLKDVLRERAVMQWRLELDAEALHARLLERNQRVRYPDLVDELFLARRRERDERAWGDKTPHYLGDVKALDGLFPNARYLYIVRDGRDVARSLLDKEWGPNNLYTAAEYWARLNRTSATLESLETAGRLHFLRYEDLSDDVEHHIREICTFLNEDVAESEIVRLAGTVRKGNSYKWKQALSAREIRLFESVAGDTLVRFGYDVEQKREQTSGLRHFAYRLHDRLVWLRFMFRTNVIDGFQIRFLGKEPFSD